MAHVSLHADGPVFHVRLDRPDDGNRLTSQMIGELQQAFRSGRKGAARAFLLSAAGDAFCLGAGAEFEAGATGREDGPSRGAGAWTRETLGPLLGTMVDLDVPVVAAIDGPAVGAGLALALLADHRIASPEATLAIGDDAVEVIGCGLPWLLTHSLDRSRARTILSDATPVAAPRARELGLVDEVVAGDTLMERCEEIGATWARRPAWATSIGKALRAADELAFEEWQTFAGYLVEEAESSALADPAPRSPNAEER